MRKFFDYENEIKYLKYNFLINEFICNLYVTTYNAGYILWVSSFIRTHEFLCRDVFNVKAHAYIHSLKHKRYVNTLLHISFFNFLQKMNLTFSFSIQDGNQKDLK